MSRPGPRLARPDLVIDQGPPFVAGRIEDFDEGAGIFVRKKSKFLFEKILNFCSKKF
jgi:hypothetical protein